jgi:diguanylate cyclase (GGDEF)-like protein
VVERVRTDSELFKLASDNIDVFKQEFLKLHHTDIQVDETEFWNYYFTDDKGATRMKREYFDGILTKDGSLVSGLSSFIGNNQSVEDPDFQRRLVLAARVLSKLGPAWVNRFANVHVAYPENAISLYYPAEPWGLIARADLPMNELGVIRTVNEQENPERQAIWSGLYYDETAEEWMLTYMDPLYVDDRHLITPAHDIYLSDLMERLIEQSGDGTYNFIIRKDGYLVAHPSQPTDAQKWVGQLKLEDIDIPSVTEAYRLIEQELADGFDTVKIIENKSNSTYLAVGQLDGPDWLFVRVFPMGTIQQAAHLSARKIFLEGSLTLCIILLIVYSVMKNQAQRPLRQLTQAAEAIGHGDFDTVANQALDLPTNVPNEIGILSVRFVEMATSIRDSQATLEHLVEERTAELEKANTALREMSLLDGLTGIHNRRAFDSKLEQVFADASQGLGTFSIVMMDIDYFKNYNDTYGHAAGDEVLKRIASTLKENIHENDSVFRFGGEEFVAILSHGTAADAQQFAASIMASIEKLAIIQAANPTGYVTISGGIEEFNPGYTHPEQLIKTADDKLYRGKNSGRNRIIS